MVSFKQASPGDETIVHQALADSRRRHVLQILSESDSPMTLADLAAATASRELDESDGSADEDRIRQVQIDLYHVHLPKLDDLGTVEFDAARETVSLADSAASRSILTVQSEE